LAIAFVMAEVGFLLFVEALFWRGRHLTWRARSEDLALWEKVNRRSLYTGKAKKVTIHPNKPVGWQYSEFVSDFRKANHGVGQQAVAKPVESDLRFAGQYDGFSKPKDF